VELKRIGFGEAILWDRLSKPYRRCCGSGSDGGDVWQFHRSATGANETVTFRLEAPGPPPKGSSVLVISSQLMISLPDRCAADETNLLIVV
jgi:hypothetical protein